jgi:hypothetical protein
VFPRSQSKIGVDSDVIPDSQPASHSGGTVGGGKQGVDMENAANILKQLSLEENQNEDDLEEEDSDDRSINDSNSDGHESNDGLLHDTHCGNSGFYSESDPGLPQSQAVIPVDSVPVVAGPSSQTESSFIAEPGPTVTMTTTAMAISPQTPEMQLTSEPVNEVLQHCDQPSIDKAPGPALVQQGQSRSSSRLTKARQVVSADDRPSLSSPIQAIDNVTTGPGTIQVDNDADVPLPKPKHATRGRATATKSNKGKGHAL